MPGLPSEPLAPPLFVGAFITCVAGAAALAHCAIFAALLKRRLRTGLFSIIIQLSIADILLLGTTAGPEFWSLNLRTWQFGATGCVAYQGLNVFTGTLSTYLVIAITLHTLTIIGHEEKAAKRKIKLNLRDEEEEIGSSQHSLVASSDSATPPRTMNLDYRMADTRVPVTLPTLLIWVLAISLSIPEYTLASIINSGNSDIVCALDSKHQFNVYSFLTVFNLFLPLFLISVTGVLIVIKLKTVKNVTAILDCSESIAALKLSLCLMCVHILFCAPRSFATAFSVYLSSVSENESTPNYLNGDTGMISFNFVSSFTYLTASLIRPLLCLLMIPKLRFLFMFNSMISKVV